MAGLSNSMSITFDHRYARIDTQQVVHEVFDGEVLAINLETGAYYSLPGASHELWLLVNDGLPVSDIVDHFIAAHEGNSDAVDAAVREFLARLSAESLIFGSETPKAALPAAVCRPSIKSSTPLPVFEFKMFTDMQDLLLLDPIHDIEDEGWPIARMQDVKPAEE
jgi:hypothetical protein